MAREHERHETRPEPASPPGQPARPPEDADRALVDAVRDGSGRAFEALMVRHERAIYRLAFAYTRQHHDALDLSQEIFLTVHEKLGTFRGSGTFRSWLLRLAHRRCLNWWRDSRRQRATEALTPDSLPAVPPTQEAELLAGERSAALRAALARLGARQQLALALRYYERLPVPEIAAVLGCSQDVTRNILYRGLEKLRRRLGARGATATAAAAVAANGSHDHEPVSRL
jgi:RNA polymerase sigma-70 factor (ECF subfamily)